MTLSLHALLETDPEAARGALAEWGARRPAAAVESLRRLRDRLDAAARRAVFAGIARGLSAVADPDRALRNLERLAEAAPEAFGAGGGAIEREEAFDALLLLLGASQFLADVLIRHPDWIGDLAPGDEAAPTADALTEELRARARHGQTPTLLRQGSGGQAGTDDENDARAEAVRWQRRRLLRAVARVMRSPRDEAAFMAELSAIAAACVRVGLERAEAALAERFGRPMEEAEDDVAQPPSAVDLNPARFAVIALGKLGGGELNFSSDIDLIFIYSAEGETTGLDSEEGRREGRTTNHDYFRRLSERLIAFLNEMTDEGFLYRVDARLRPDGAEGPLARSLAAYEIYHETQARPWERLALVRAEAIAGDAEFRRAARSMLRALAYGRRPGPEFIAHVRELKDRIDENAAQPASAGSVTQPPSAEVVAQPPPAVILIDLKRGRGGIRELEFLVQTLQLLHGARDPAARNPAIVEVVEALARAGRLTPAEAKSIRQDYLFLRVVENRIQLLEARQTHALPKDAAALESLARRCGSDGAALLAQLSEVAGRVHRRFVERFGESAAQSPSAALRSPSARAAARLSEGAREAELIPLLAPFGLESPGAIACLKRLGGGGSVYLDEAARRRWGEIAPKLIEAAGASARPAQALARLESFLAAAGSMAGMYEIFGANPRVPELLLQAFGATDVWARTLTAHPEYLDYLLDARQLAEDPAKAALRERLDKWISTSGIMLHTPSAALARFRAFEYMMAGIAELAGLATYEEAVARLTRIAEAIIERALDWTVGDSKNYRGFSILAMGKLGASELHYASDLDLIFVYEGESGDWDEDRASGVATRLLETLTATTSEGRAFAADARLRPEGQNAPLAPARSRYLDYYRGRADLWELQSLMKLRPIAGDMQLGERLKSELIQIAADRIETMGAEDVTKRIVEMRRRIEEAARTPEWVLCDFKKGPGGSIDIEFIAQRIQLLHLRERPEWVGLAADRVIERALRPLVAQPPSAVIPGELALARELIADYLFLRRLESRARLLFETDRSQAPAGGEKWEALARAAADLTSPGARDLRDGLLQTLRRVRNRFDRIMGGDAR